MSHEKKLGRRDSLKLATAVTALGAGLGVVLDGNEASAETVKLRATDLGNFTVKLYKQDAEGKASLLETVDIGALSSKMTRGGAFVLKMYNHKLETPTLLSEQALTVETITIKNQR